METSKSHTKWWLIILIVLFLLLCCCLVFGFMVWAALGSATSGMSLNSNQLSLDYISGNSASTSKILSVPITGVILNEKPRDALTLLASGQATYGYEIKQILAEAAKDSSIKGVILEIDSPGGTITGAKAISDAVAAYRTSTGNPVVAHIMGMGASGAYWSAAATDYIIADEGSLIGSIGVILGPFQYYDKVLSQGDSSSSITTENGISTYYITSGTYKDFGNPDRPMTAEERQIMQADTDNAYAEFVSFVSNRRNIPEGTIRTQIKALPYGNGTAQAYGLIDTTGPKEMAESYITGKTGIGIDYQVVSPHLETNFWSMLFSGSLFQGVTQPQAQSSSLTRELSGKLLYLYGTPAEY